MTGTALIGLFKTEGFNRRGPWRTVDAVALAALDWIDLVQPRPAARLDRACSSSRVRKAVSQPGDSSHGGRRDVLQPLEAHFGHLDYINQVPEANHEDDMGN